MMTSFSHWMLDIANIRKRCTVARCSNKNKDGVSLFKFPIRKKIREQWIKQVKRTRAGWTSPSDYSVMCSCHFTEKCFETSKFTIRRWGILSEDKNITPCSLPHTLVPFLCSTYSHLIKTEAIAEHTSWFT